MNLLLSIWRVPLVVIAFLLPAVPGAELQEQEPPKKAVYLEIAVVGKADHGQKSFSTAEVKEFFKLDKRFWPDHSRVVLFQRPASSTIQELMLKHVYGTSESHLRKHFVSLLNKGKVQAIPSVVPKDSLLKRLILHKGGSLAVMEAGKVPEGLHVFPIDGKKPGEKGYPLRFEVEPATTE